MSETQMKPIWYFVGLMLLTMGTVIFISGLYHLVYPPATRTVLSEHHPAVWWGAFTAVFGGVMFLLSKKTSR